MKNTCVTLDITTSNIRVMSIENGKVTKWHSEPLPDGLFKAGTIGEQQAVSVIIDNLFKTLNLSRTRVICCVTGLPFTYRTINMPGIGKEVSDEAVERAAKKEMSLSEEDMFLAWQPVNEHEDKKETDFFVTGVPKTSLNPLLNTLSMAKIDPLSIDLKPLALARTVSAQNALIVSLEKNYFDITLVANGMVRIIHSISPQLSAEDTQGIVAELVDSLNKAVKSYYRESPQNGLPPETSILICGEFASEEMLRPVQEATGHPTSILKSPFEIPSEIPVRIYGANLGLILKNVPVETEKTQYKDININLLSALRKQPKHEFKLIYAIIAIIIVVLAAGIYYTYDQKVKAEDRVATLTHDSALLVKKVGEAQQANKEALNSKQAALAQQKTINDQIAAAKTGGDQIAALKRDYTFRIDYILSKLPPDAEYTKISMQPRSIQVSGLVKYPVNAITGEYENPIGEVQFAEQVAQNDIFNNARVINVAPSGDPAKAEFTVLITE
jgi:hypothetical protein